jgi:non-canonical purine NTP pyrophosphatase (RdgB/HAM1 family)
MVMSAPKDSFIVQKQWQAFELNKGRRGPQNGCDMKRVLVATSNPGKIRDLVGAALAHNVQIEMLPGFSSLPSVVEDGATFEANARKKAEEYSKHAAGEIVIADDSGLEVDALGGAPGVRSARYASDEQRADNPQPGLEMANENSAAGPGQAMGRGSSKPFQCSIDEANNARLLRELHDVPDEFRTARFVCAIAAARNGHTLATFHGKAEGLLLRAPHGSNGFGYDPLFYFPEISKTFAELSAAEKARYSHRGAAFRAFLAWEDESAGGGDDLVGAALFAPSALAQQTTDFVSSVLALKPEIAVFDCDGTLWSGDAGADFFYWEIERGLVSPKVGEWARARYQEYVAGKVSEIEMCGEMVTINRGISNQVLQRAAEEFFEEVVSPRIFPELQELTRRLAEQGCELWAVSSTNNWVVDVGARRFTIPPDHVLAARVEVENGCATGRLIRVPTDELKAVVIRDVIGKPMEAVFGNSIHDRAMLELAKWPFCVNPNPDLERIARERGWTVYWPEGMKK